MATVAFFTLGEQVEQDVGRCRANIKNTAADQDSAMPLSQKSAILLLVSLVAATTSPWSVTTRAHAAPIIKRNDRIYSYGSLGPNVSCRARPRTASTSPNDRGWTAVPRCFQETANSPITLFHRDIHSRGRTAIARSIGSPLNPPFDLSGYPLVMTPW